MSKTEVPFEGRASDKAVLLLAAAEQLGLDASVVETQAGGFLVPDEVAKKAFSAEEKSEEKPAKKAAAKKSTPKKSQE